MPPIPSVNLLTDPESAVKRTEVIRHDPPLKTDEYCQTDTSADS